MERRDYIQREISKLSILLKKLLNVLDEKPIEAINQNTIDTELANHFKTNLLDLSTADLIDYCEGQNFSHENMEQLLFLMNSYNTKFPNKISDCNEKLSAIYSHLQKNGDTISFEIYSLVSCF